MGHPFEQFVVFNVFLWNTRLTSLRVLVVFTVFPRPDVTVMVEWV